jgi:hypothetical protein
MRISNVLPLTAVALALLAAPADATPPALGVQPEQRTANGPRPVSYFAIQGRPGQAIRAGRISVVNHGRRAVTVAVDAVDAQTAQNLGSAYRVPGVRTSGATRWLRLSTRRLSIPAGGRRDIGVTVRLPSQAGAGDHLSGVSIQATGQRTAARRSRNVTVSSAQRFVVGVETTVPGRRSPGLVLTGARVVRNPGGVTFLVGARNSGNVILRGVRGSITVLRQGRRVARERFGPGTFVTHSAVDLSVLAGSEQPAAGTEYRVRAAFVYPGGRAGLDRMVRFGKRDAVAQERYGGPKASRRLAWWLVAAVLVVVALACAAALRARSRRRSAVAPASDWRPIVDGALVTAQEATSVLVIEPVAAGASERGGLLAAVQEHLRPRDTLCKLDEHALLVVAPGTGHAMAAALAHELESSLGAAPAAQSPPAKVGAATATSATSADELVELARRETATASRSAAVSEPSPG